MLRGGTTCCNENYFFPDVQAATYRRLGFRAVVGLPFIEFPSAWAASPAEYFDKALEVHDNYRRDPLVSLQLRAACALHRVSDASFERIRMLAEQLDLPVHCHVHETAQEIEDSLKQHGQRPLARMDRLGLVNERLIAVHMTQLTDAEIAQCAERGVSVVHCPQSNLKLASGFCPVEKLRRAGVNVAIGTDGCASNNDLDMFDEMRTAALLAKGVAADATRLGRRIGPCRAATLRRRQGPGPGRPDRLDRAGQAGRPDLRAHGRARNPADVPPDLAAGLCHRAPAGQRRLDRRPAQAGRGQAGRYRLPSLLARVGQWRQRIASVRSPCMSHDQRPRRGDRQVRRAGQPLVGSRTGRSGRCTN